MLNEILLLVYRNLKASVNKLFLLWQIVFPVIYIFIAGQSYSTIIEKGGIEIGSIFVSYSAYLAVGMIAFNVMNSSMVSGSIIWSDKRNGMFQQILVMPFTRIHYIIGNLMTIIIIGLVSAGLIVISGIPLIFKEIQLSPFNIAYTIFALIAGSVFFGSFTITVATKIKNSEMFNVISNGIFIFFAFASSSFYPINQITEQWKIVFYLNPLTYVVDITRAGLFNQITPFTNIEIIIITIISLLSFMLSSFLLSKMKI